MVAALMNDGKIRVPSHRCGFKRVGGICLEGLGARRQVRSMSKGAVGWGGRQPGLHSLGCDFCCLAHVYQRTGGFILGKSRWKEINWRKRVRKKPPYQVRQAGEDVLVSRCDDEHVQRVHALIHYAQNTRILFANLAIRASARCASLEASTAVGTPTPRHTSSKFEPNCALCRIAIAAAMLPHLY
eukprot:9457037-Pyramimonas_sp.AAC.1